MSIDSLATRDINYLSEMIRDVKYVHYNIVYSEQGATAEPQAQTGSTTNADYWVIGTVSRTMRYSENVQSPNCELVFNMNEGLFSYREDFSLKEKRKTIIREIETIVRTKEAFANDLKNREPHANVGLVICFGEFDYPYQRTHDRVVEEDADNQADEKFRAQLQNLSNSHDCIILAGSFHQIDTKNKNRNTALLFEPGKTKPTEHIKWRPAQKLGEKTQHPTKNNHIRRYKTKFGTIGILICMDAYDLNLALSLARGCNMQHVEGAGEDRPRSEEEFLSLLLVPSYNGQTKEPLPGKLSANGYALNACERIAYLVGTTVSYVNSAYFTGAETAVTRAVVCPTEKIDEPDIDLTSDETLLHKTLTVQTVPGEPPVSNIRIDVVNIDYMVDQRKLARGAYSKEMRSILLGETLVEKGDLI